MSRHKLLSFGDITERLSLVFLAINHYSITIYYLIINQRYRIKKKTTITNVNRKTLEKWGEVKYVNKFEK